MPPRPPGSEERERAKDQVPGYPVGSHDHPVPSRRPPLDQDLGVLRPPGQACDELGIRHRPVDDRVPPEIPEPSSREDRHPLGGEPETPGDIPADSGEPHLFLDRPALVDPDRGGEEEEMPVSGLEEGNPFQMIDACSLLEGFQGG